MAVDCVERVCVDASRIFVIPAFVSDLEQRQKAGYSGIVELHGIDGEGQFESSTVGWLDGRRHRLSDVVTPTAHMCNLVTVGEPTNTPWFSWDTKGADREGV